jgi:hypothetical protein
MKLRLFLAIIFFGFLTGCGGSFQVGIEHTPSAPAPTQTTIVLPSPTPVVIPATPTISVPTPTQSQPAPTVSVPTVSVPTKTSSVPANTPGPQLVGIYLIGIGDNGQGGILIGCGDSAIPVQVQIEPTQGVLRAALEKLLSIKDQFYGQSGLYDALYQSNLQVDGVTITKGKANVQLTGTMQLAGECDNPRVQAQLENTVLQFPTVTSADIFINGKTLAEALSLK